MPVAESMPTAVRPSQLAAPFYRLVSWLFAGKPVSEAVQTRIHFPASPATIWAHIMFYEEVPGRLPLFLRAFLPHPVRSEGDKTSVGATVRCIYRFGHLAKRIITVEPPHTLRFEVIQQCLGIEGCVLTHGGSYQIHSCGDASDVVLITKYRAYLYPRVLWRPVERLLVGHLHRHILWGVSAAVHSGNTPAPAVAAESLTPQCVPAGDLACTASQSSSLR